MTDFNSEFEAQFNSSEARAPRPTEIPVGEFQYVVKKYNVKDGNKVGLFIYAPKYNLHEWVNYGEKAAGVLKSALIGMGADVTNGIAAALESAVGRTGKATKSLTEPNEKGKTYARFTFLSGEPTAKSEDDLPF